MSFCLCTVLDRERSSFVPLSHAGRAKSFFPGGDTKHEKHNLQKPRWDRIWVNEQPSIRLLSKKCPAPRLKHKEKTRIFHSRRTPSSPLATNTNAECLN